MSNLVHNKQVKLAATFWNNVAVLLGVFLVPAFYTRHTMLRQALSIAVGLAAAIGLRMLAHWWLTRLRE
jgi:membrane protein DedA with SNARE-associated domain